MRSGSNENNRENCQTIASENALHCTCAENIFASTDYPEVPRTKTAGIVIQYYAIKQGIISFTPVAEYHRISGSFTLTNCIPLEVGESVPSKFDTLIPIGQFVQHSDMYNLIIGNTIAQGQHIEFQGDVVKKGAAICLKGDLISTAVIKILAMAGIKSILVKT